MVGGAGGTAGLSSSAEYRLSPVHCWASQQWHPSPV